MHVFVPTTFGPAQLFDQGLHEYTWRTEESADFIETATALVCVDLHLNLDIVQTNCNEIMQLTLGWSQGVLDVFAARQHSQSSVMQDLVESQLYVGFGGFDVQWNLHVIFQLAVIAHNINIILNIECTPWSEHCTDHINYLSVYTRKEYTSII